MAFISVPFNNLNDHRTAGWVSRHKALLFFFFFLVFFYASSLLLPPNESGGSIPPCCAQRVDNAAASEVTHVNVCRITQHSKNTLQEPALAL